MSELAGYESRRELLRLAGSLALNVFALAAFSIAQPAQAADFGYGYGAPQEYRVPVYPPQPRYGEIYEQRAPAYPPHAQYYEAPLEYRVLVYPPRPRYAEPQSYPPSGYPSRAHYGEYYDGPYDHRAGAAPRPYAPRPVYREAQVHRPYGDPPYEPYGRSFDPDAPIPPGLVGPPRW